MTSDHGAIGGFAYNDNHDNHDCTYGPAFDWFYVDAFGKWEKAREGLTIASFTKMLTWKSINKQLIIILNNNYKNSSPCDLYEMTGPMYL